MDNINQVALEFSLRTFTDAVEFETKEILERAKAFQQFLIDGSVPE